ncbi:hypothetical protein [Pseudobacteroides cellulosolvens]|uniref:Uncharacterized protein n=1 Tax=Pseudobacteroides cellulosolvens ATCC 35603 = DSM 2933 TaxID=398512 RepID=A0A0L6JRN6_9FIRM|nr:hypothetical protein [Pseudobacteroides cellulosolvens]KNY28350.1 hypothetical protein Bccel_3624 [Pseudobacteroides cellulosolvens ATCC 35603 = DSM 2933]
MINFNFNIKSIVLGIGIGIIITSLISIIYLAGNDTKNTITNEEIISRAAKLGMVKSSSIPEIKKVLPGYDLKEGDKE